MHCTLYKRIGKVNKLHTVQEDSVKVTALINILEESLKMNAPFPGRSSVKLTALYRRRV